MWILFGTGAIIFAVFNLIWTFQGKTKTATWFRFISMALTALTLCAFYSDCASRVVAEDWSGLMDVMPTMSTALWICTIASIAINSVSLLTERIIRKAGHYSENS
jgi:hypothetical protein